LRHFVPLVTNPHLLTILGHLWPRNLETRRYPVERRLFRTEPDVQVLVLTQLPEGSSQGEMMLVHGLEGSGEAGYMLSMAQAGLQAGFVMNRFHMRTCGGTEKLCRTLYHAGLTSDLHAVLREMQQEGRTPVHLVGYSLGGNVVLKLAGELGENALVASVCALSTPLDLGACARRMGQRDNRIYERRFVKRMRERLSTTGRAKQAELRDVRSVYEIDDRFTAPSFGFRNAEHYYETQSAGKFLERIRVPALLIQAKDDTFIPFEIFKHPAIRQNSYIRLVATEQGGHLGFVARKRPRFWPDEVVLEWVRTAIKA